MAVYKSDGLRISAYRNGNNGISFDSIVEYYKANNSNSEPPSGAGTESTAPNGWSTSISEAGHNEQNKYLWNIEGIVSKDADGKLITKYTSPEVIQVWNGRTIKQVLSYYATSSNSNQAPSGYPVLQNNGNTLQAGSWDNIPQISEKDGSFLWETTITEYNSKDTNEQNLYEQILPHVIGYNGKNGTDGKGVSIKGTAYTTETLTDDSVGKTFAIYSDEALTNQITTNINDGDSYLVNGYLLVYTGTGSLFSCSGKIQGPPGSDGQGVTNVINYYMASSRDMNVVAGKDGETEDEQWIITPVPLTTEEKPYLWNYEEVIYSTGKSQITDPTVVGYYTQDGRGIKSIQEIYCITSEFNCATPTESDFVNAQQYSSGNTPTANTWYKNSPPTDFVNIYLWNAEKIEYTDDSQPSILGPVLIGTHGTAAKDFNLTADAYAFKKTSEGYANTITLTAHPINLGEELVIEWYKNGDLIYGNNGRPHTGLTYQPSTSGTYKAKVRDTDWEDSVVIIEISDGLDGSDGSDGIAIVLTNPNSTFHDQTADEPEYCEVIVYEGGEQLRYANSGPGTFSLIEKTDTQNKASIDNGKIKISDPTDDGSAVFTVTVRPKSGAAATSHDYTIYWKVVRDGINGTSPYLIELDNDSAIIGADKDGNYDRDTLIAVSTINVTVSEGKENITTSCSFTWSASGGTLNPAAGSSNSNYFETLTADTASATVTVKKDGTLLGTKQFTISKNKQGNNAVSYILKVTPPVINLNNRVPVEAKVIKVDGNTQTDITNAVATTIQYKFSYQNTWTNVIQTPYWPDNMWDNSGQTANTLTIRYPIDAARGLYEEETVTTVKNGERGDSSLYDIILSPNPLTIDEFTGQVTIGISPRIRNGNSWSVINSAPYNIWVTRNGQSNGRMNMNDLSYTMLPDTIKTLNTLYFELTRNDTVVNGGVVKGEILCKKELTINAPVVVREITVYRHSSTFQENLNEFGKNQTIVSGSENVTNGWTKTVLTPVSGSYQYIYSRTVTETINKGNATYSNWGAPTLHEAMAGNSAISNEAYTEFMKIIQGKKDNSGLYHNENGELFVNASFIKTGHLLIQENSTSPVIFSASISSPGTGKPWVTIGGWNVDSNGLTQGNFGSNGGFHMYASGVEGTLSGTPGKWCLAIGSNFGVTSEGKMVAQAGSIGDWEVYTKWVNDQRYAGLQSQHTITTEVWEESEQDWVEKDMLQGTGFQPPHSGVWAIAVNYSNENDWSTASFKVKHNGDVYLRGNDLIASIVKLSNIPYSAIGSANALKITKLGQSPSFGTAGALLASSSSTSFIAIRAQTSASYLNAQILNFVHDNDHVCRLQSTKSTTSDGSYISMRFNHNNGTSFTTSAKFYKEKVEFSKTVYTPDGTVSKSDYNTKNSITPLSAQYDSLFNSLKPVKFKYNDGTSDRYHTGFIAQEVMQSVVASDLTSQDFAAVCISNPDTEEERWGLRYEEFVSLNTWQIQLLKPRMTAAEEKIAALELEVSTLKQELENLKKT